MSTVNPYDALLQISEEIGSVHDTAELLDRITDIAMGVLKAERGFMLLKSGNSGFSATTARNISQESISGIQNLSSSVVNQVLENGEPVLTFDAQSDSRFASAESVVIQQIRSIACTPLLRKNEVIGAIYMDSRINTEQFNDESLQFLQAFARQAALAIENARLFEKLQTENRQLKKQISLSTVFPEIIGESREIQEILDMIDRVADAKATVLIEGESGTGKELVARALHYHSSRKDKLFVPVFCGGLTESLLESELFGHKKGAFTGAIDNKAGLFEEADGGTIFLDEIGDINMNVQTKLLRVIQEGEIKRVGDAKSRIVDVRIVSATNKDLWKEVQAKRFREDLYYRLNVINIKMPALRERDEDILVLGKHFLKKFARINNKAIDGFSQSAENSMLSYQWPGNIRELENTVERAVILARSGKITPDLLNLSKTRVNDLAGKTLREIERAVIAETLEITGHHRARTAEILGVSRRWLQYRIKEWGLDDKE
ncbi:MAG: sigma 54-interacting transcriptional regulator [Calditrichaeota bacterium]|nr:sigma 54-interacting transcriptional regulator [Calditrichota bacterium]MCB0269342.1 sigma 54-interacting transcriptional regulator [Calditrichota bacterium]MCB0285705.1 sigma 54-interacting transcriptional regulator [Calditrichota bacterium]MCB9067147.1 sigma 54-interacting transcriptional regulator [Calditrichia bacterium]